MMKRMSLQKTASYHLLAGLLYHKNRNIEEACVEYELAMACDPSNTQAKELFELATQQFSLWNCFVKNMKCYIN